MASPSTQDPTAPPSEALFDHRPSSDLGDTIPFSLLNALLEGEPDAPRYDPPALKRKAKPLPPKAKRIIEGKKLEPILEKMPVVAEQPKPKPSPEAQPAPKPKAAPKPLQEPKAETVVPQPPKESPTLSEPAPAEIEAEKVYSKPAPVEAKAEPAVSQKPLPKAPETPAAAPPPPKKQLPPTEAKKAPPLEPKPLVEATPVAEESKPPPPPARFPEIRGATITPPPPPRPKRRAKPTPLKPPSDLQSLSQPAAAKPETKPSTSPPSTTPKPLLSEHESRLQKRHGRIIQHRVSKSFDPINKAIRIFESLEASPPETPEPKVEETPKAPEPKAETATPAPIAAPPAVETLPPEAPAPEPPTSKPAAPAPPTPPPEVPEAPPVRVCRRRRRRAPVNPWTAKSVFPKEDSPANRQQHIDDALASLAKILEGTLDTPAPPPKPASASAVAAASDEPVVLNQSFGKTQRQGQSKVKLLPRELPESRKPPVNPEDEVLSLDDLEITAPTAIVAKDAPISPFTKVVPGPTEPTPGAAPQPSPFRIATPTDKPAVVDTEKASTFASPFSTALKKRQSAPAAPVSQGNPQPTILPIKPPADPEAEAAIAAGNLPAPTYSFSTMGLPSAQHPGPVQTPVGAPPVGPPIFQTPADAHPDRIASPDPPTSTVTAVPAVVAEARGLPEPEVRTKRKQRPKPEPGSWGFLTWILAFVCVTFLIIYIHEIQQTLQRNSAKPFSPLIPPDAADRAEPLEPADPAGLINLNDATLLEPELTPTERRRPLQSNANLTEPLECLNQFLNAETTAVRQRYVLEPADLERVMETHYQEFPLQANTTRRIVGSGTFADSGREHFTVTLGWEDDTETDVRMIKDSVGNHRFSWHAFEQSRNRLLRQYTETAWTDWTHFFIQIKPALAEALPEDTILDHLWFRVTVPEDPEFEALAYVDENSSMLKDFKERFPNQSNYEVIAELLRGDSNLPGDDRPVFRIARLINDSWDPSPSGGQ